MGIFRRTLAVAGWGSLGATASYVVWTRKCKFDDIPPSDYILNHTLFARYNPNNGPITQDRCTRKVPLDQLRPELIEQEGKLVEAFCAGVWSGNGYAAQRRILEQTHRGPATAGQLWTRDELRSSPYAVGTVVTDHFEVVARTGDSIMLRCGDTPREAGVRESDGLFELTARVRADEGVAEFGMKTVFFNGLSRPDAPPATGLSAHPMPAPVKWLHQQYAKLLMETGLRNCTK